MAINFKNEEEVKEYLENIGVEYKFSCLKEKNAEGCQLLGDYLESVKNEPEAAANTYKENCDERNFAKSCQKYGSLCYLGKGTEANRMTAFNYFKKACELNSPDGCLYTGVMLTKEAEMEKNYVEGLKYLEKSCTMGNPTACYFASGLCIEGAEGVPQDRNKASKFSLLACNGGNVFACMNLSQMYKTGDGVEKDEKKANEFKQRAREIRDDMRKKQTIDLQQYS